MAYVVKRYANRKLYDTRTKRYLTLDEVAVLVRAGEEVRVEDAESGADLTAQVLARIVAEGGRGGLPLVPAGTLVDLIRRPGEIVADAVRTGQKTVEQVSGEVGKLIDTVTGYAGKGRKQVESAGDEIARTVERRLRALLAEMNVATRDDVAALEARVAALEGAVKRTQRQAATATKAAAKAAARKTPARRAPAGAKKAESKE